MNVFEFIMWHPFWALYAAMLLRFVLRGLKNNDN